MNTLELKGGLTEMIAEVDNKEVLSHLYEIVSEIISQAANYNQELSAEQETALDRDIEASFLSENLVEHKMAVKRMERWLKK